MLKNDARLNPSTDYLSELLGDRVASVYPLDGGRNSRTFTAIAEDGSKYIAKVYLDPTADGESRLAAEFSSLKFLHRKGIDCVPRPVVSDHGRQTALYEFVEGAKVGSSQATAADIDQMCRFLLRLNELKDDPESVQLPKAAEACFSVQAIIRNLEGRLDQLRTVDGPSPWSRALHGFLGSEFIPTFRRTEAWCRKRITSTGISMDSALDHGSRTLSPSDFGFHNCIRRSNGELVFLDFEYFGWDDPAKTICDFLLHPAMALKLSLKQSFVDTMVGAPNQDQALLDRTETVYPLFGLKWCLILLNPFLPDYWLRRSAAGADASSRNGLLEKQLEKARLMLNMIGPGDERFPFRGERYVPNVI